MLPNTGSLQITEIRQHGVWVGVFKAAFEEYGLNSYGLDFFYVIDEIFLYIVSFPLGLPRDSLISS